MHPESFEHEQNIPTSHKNVPEYLEWTQNAVKSLKMQFDYQRIYNEFLFRRQSGSFRHYSVSRTICYIDDDAEFWNGIVR